MIRRENLLADQFVAKLGQLPRQTKRFIMLASDAVMVPLALWCALGLRFAEPFSAPARVWWLYPLAVLISLPIMARLGLYRAVVRFMGARVVISVVYGVSLITLLFGTAAWFFSPANVPLTALAIFWTVAILYVGGSRFAARSLLQNHHGRGERVAIYGAGGAGARLATALVGGQEFLPVAFLDDNVALHGSVINGIEVFAPDELPRLVQDLEISRVLLAVPSASRRRRKRIISKLESVSVHVQTMPNFSDLISGIARVDEIREVDVADLLGRETVPPNDALLDACIREKVVMVTGAGGSIGSELCRQILRLEPTTLVLVEISELALYNIDKELSGVADLDNLNVRIVSLLGSVQDKPRMRQIMQNFAVETVYHAAAYKHVPVVENNMLEGISNNLFGTLNAAEAAIEAGVTSFVLVSTDKAVCPTNVMGATKRMAEIVLQGLHQRGTKTRFCMVRFGNVLESSGSVVPLFRDQIGRGGPVTVTHPEIIRYFMTIPEAAQLVIQAGSMATGGDVFVLDMGKPVRIEYLARRMIHLMGLSVLDKDHPDGDIEIKYTGLRPAEKLYEELLIGNNVMGTHHPMIMRAEEKFLPWERVNTILGSLSNAIRTFDCESARDKLVEAVDEYSPAASLIDLAWTQSQRARLVTDKKATVTALASKRHDSGDALRGS